MTGQIQDGQLSADLKKLRDDKRTIDQLNGVDVEFELEGTILKQIRRKGETFVAAAAPPPQSAQHRGQQGRDQTQRGRKDSRTQSQPASQKPEKSMPESAFHNPYNFVPAPPRQTDHPDLGDHAPIGQHVLHPDRYTGVIHVKLTVQTPLLLPDAANAQDCPNDHKSFPVRVDAEGKPYLPPTSIKGMLRSAYEAVTNSRLAVFVGHEDRLGRRMGSDEGLGLVPCRIEGDSIRLLPGTSRISANRPNGPMYAAWLPFDLLRQLRSQSALPAHRDAVSCWIELWERTPWHRYKKQFEPHKRFQYWKVLRLGRRGQAGPRPNPSPAVSQQQGRNHHTPVLNVPLREIDGYACMTDYNFDRKYNERVFFEDAAGNALPILPEHGAQWSNLIRDYRTNQDLLMGRDRPGALQNAGWSRHMTDNEELELSVGSLAYALIEPSGNTWRVRELFPVCISRRLFESSPLSLLPESLRPATSLSQLSPADRVFGWVNQQGHGSCKGNVRVGPVKCETPKEQAIADFGTPGLPLAILGQPKPQQARFYVAKTPNGEAQGDRLSKQDAGYSPGKGLRGRKVYPHHQGLPDGHWDNAMTDRTQRAVNGHFQEYRRPRLNGHEQCDNQNRSIQGWVKPGTVFTFDLHVTNLSKVELGALLWLLSLPKDHFHRLGGGKPLGFGSVRLEIDAEGTHLHNGHGWKQLYSTLDDTTPPETNRDEIVRAFQEAVQTSHGSPASFDQVPFIAAWLKMATGYADNLPTHYPRVSAHPDSAGENFRWFTANERGQGVCLGNLANDPGLPLPNPTQGGN
jgi:CRISPR-associated protein (TIGR03986 family)